MHSSACNPLLTHWVWLPTCMYVCLKPRSKERGPRPSCGAVWAIVPATSGGAGTMHASSLSRRQLMSRLLTTPGWQILRGALVGGRTVATTLLRYLRRCSALDVRSLALFRVLLASLGLWDVLNRMHDPLMPFPEIYRSAGPLRHRSTAKRPQRKAVRTAQVRSTWILKRAVGDTLLYWQHSSHKTDLRPSSTGVVGLACGVSDPYRAPAGEAMPRWDVLSRVSIHVLFTLVGSARRHAV
eukprot:scaffold2280_cov430-Prasinococcus_capsulatus_cf.AAC.24